MKRSDKYSDILGKLYDAQEGGKPVNIVYKEQKLTGIITIVQIRNDTFEIETESDTVEGSIWDVAEVNDER